MGIAVLPNESAEIGMAFNNAGYMPTNLYLYEPSDGKAERVESRWQFDREGNLVINVAPLRPSLAKPLTLRYVAAADDQLNAIGEAFAALRRGNSPRSSDPRGDKLPVSEMGELDGNESPAGLQPVADPLQRSPFRAVKWTDWTPFVDVQGQWYELTAVDTIPVDTPVEVDIDAGERADVLFAPADALIRQGDDAVLFVAVGDRAQRRAVATGLAESGRVEITSGLQPGELIITRGHIGLADGAKISADVR